MIEILESFDFVKLLFAAFGAGFIDSIVGGGGLIQLPALLMILPQYPVVSILATNKLVSMSGTAFSTYRYSRQIPFQANIIFPAIVASFFASLFGALTVTFISNETIKPVFIVLLFIVFIVTIRNKDFGILNHRSDIPIALWKPILIGTLIGFYDGFFGPGTGSFLIISFVGLLGMTFVEGSAYAKVINLTTNLAAILIFSFKTEFLFKFAIPMMIFNTLGAVVGVRLALLKRNEFVRILLRMVVFATILKLGHQVFMDYLR
jgi:hypothetical protein